MKHYWDKYEVSFNARVLRERIILACCVLGLVYFLCDFLFFSAIRERQSKLSKQYESANSELKKLVAEEMVFSKSLRNNPNFKKQKEVQRLEGDLKRIDKEISDLSSGLVPSEKLPDVLREVLSNTKNIHLLGLEAKKPEKLRLISDSGDVDADSEENEIEEESDQVGVYKHGVVVRLHGQYFSILDYLVALEKSGWDFYWSSMDYSVEEYPDAIVQLEAYTLSTERGFIVE